MLITTLSITLGLLAPNHPKDIVFPEYVFSPPSAETYKEVLPCGIPVFIVEDKELPLINIVMTFRGGDYLDPANKVGLHGTMASLVRSGGTDSMSAEDLDEQFAYLAANASVRGGSTTITASLNCLSSNFDESFDLFLNMVRMPGFQDSRLQLYKDNAIEEMKQRNDFPSQILRREFSSLLFGKDSYIGRNETQSTILSITQEDVRAAHASVFNPSNCIISASGDFDRFEMLQLLERKLADWGAGVPASSPPDVPSAFTPGVYYIDQDVPQGGVRIGLRSLRMGDPDAEIASLMNYILGGGGFSSRITQKVRSDEGLAYSAGSFLNEGVWNDGSWGAGFESKSKTVALAIKLIFEEIDRMRRENVSSEDLEQAKNSLIEQFPSMFQSKTSVLGVFVSDELTGRDSSYWQTYRNKIASITSDDVRRVANRILRPDDMAIMIVGNWSEIKDGDLAGRATIEDIRSRFSSSVVELPLADPLTLEVTK